MADLTYDSLNSQITDLDTKTTGQYQTCLTKIQDTRNYAESVNQGYTTLYNHVSELIEKINNLETLIGTLSVNLTNTTDSLGILTENTRTSFEEVNSSLEDLGEEDTEIHTVIHSLATLLDNATTRITALESSTSGVANSINTLSTGLNAKDAELQESITSMNQEHHLELHSISEQLDNYDSKLDSLELGLADVPEHVIMSEEEYKRLTDPDPSKLYFTYET